MKRLAAVFLAVCTVLSISTTASADDEIQLKSLDEIIDSWIDSQYQGMRRCPKLSPCITNTMKPMGVLGI